MKIHELKDGDLIRLDDGFTCARADVVQVHISSNLDKTPFFICDDGRHYLDGQVGEDGHLVGVSRA